MARSPLGGCLRARARREYVRVASIPGEGRWLRRPRGSVHGQLIFGMFVILAYADVSSFPNFQTVLCETLRVN